MRFGLVTRGPLRDSRTRPISRSPWWTAASTKIIPNWAATIVEYKNFLSGSDKDFVGHGTHVAGIIAAIAGNDLGISGVCGGKILALKVLPRDGQEFDAPAYYRALRYVIGRAQVLNLSLGSGEIQRD